MRIALFTNTYPPSLNGVANATHFYRRGLTERGHDVHVFAPAPVGDDPFEDDPCVHRYPSARVPGEVDYMLALPPPFSLGIALELEAMRFDLVHAQHPAWVGRWGQSWARRHGIPVVATAHTQYELYASRTMLPTSWIEPIVTRHVVGFFNSCDVVATPVTWMRNRLISRGVRTPVELVNNPVDLQGLAEPEPEQTRRRLGLTEEHLVVGYLGRISPEKNLECVIDAVALLADDLPRVRLLIVGDGSVFESVRERARRALGDRAILPGAVPHSEVAHYHAAMDVFATASGSETQPLAYTEAMHVGTPVVALSTPGATEMITHEGNGLLVAPDARARGLADAMQRVLTDRGLARRLIEGGRRYAAQRQYAVVAERLEEVYALARERKMARGRVSSQYPS